MLLVVSAQGDTGPLLFVFAGSKMPYSEILIDGKRVTDTLIDHLPFSAAIAMRQGSGGIDSFNILNWEKLFVKHVQTLTAGGRKLLLTYDGYRAHMTLALLEVLRVGNVIVYVLPAHTSGKTQPLDVVIFSVFKKALNEAISQIVVPLEEHLLTVFYFCDLLTIAYKKVFVCDTIVAGFAKSVLWPFNPYQLLSTHLHANNTYAAQLMSPDKLFHLLQSKKRQA